MSEQEIEREEVAASEEAQPRDEHGRFAPREREEAEEREEGPAWSPEEETQARKYGWRPQSDFTLKPESWRPPKDFLESPQTQVKILRDELRERDDKFARIERTTAAALEMTRQQERQRYESELASIREQKRAAVEQADPDSYKELDEREEALRKRAPAPSAVPMRSEAVDAYVSSPEGAWVRDPELLRWATTAVQNDPLALGMPAADQFRWAERKLRDAMPWRFPPQEQAREQPRQDPAHSRVDGGGLGGGRRSKTIKDLPKEAQEAFAMYARQGVKMTEAEYIRLYEE